MILGISMISSYTALTFQSASEKRRRFKSIDKAILFIFFILYQTAQVKAAKSSNETEKWSP